MQQMNLADNGFEKFLKPTRKELFREQIERTASGKN